MKRLVSGRTPLSIALCTLAAASALAQQEAPARKGSAAVMMEEIMVTARKKNNLEAAQDVPLAITAYGGEQLDAMFVQNLEDLSYSAPNVQLDEVGTFPGVQNFTIRGQGINSSLPSVDPTVGTFVDGVYQGVTYGVVIDMFDMESVEILRGPQGLLFGRNVTGGAVVMRTARPSGDFGFRVRSQYTDYESVNLAGSIEGSLIEDKLAAKLTIYHDDDQGYFDNDYRDNTPDLVPGVNPVYFNKSETGGNVGALETNFGRGTLVLHATDELDLTLIAESGKTDGDGAAWTDVDSQRDSGTLDEFTTNMDEAGETDLEWSSVTLEGNLKVGFGDGTITNILGWRAVDLYSVADIDGSYLSIFTAEADTAQDQVSNELRYAGSFLEGKWELTTGLYYFEQDIEYREGRFIRDGALKVALGGDMDHHTWGVFLNNDYHLNEALTLTAGLRYNQESKDSALIDSSPAAGGRCSDVVGFNCVFVDLDDDWSNLTPKIGVDYQLTDEAKLYAFWTKGFRSGGVNFRNAKPNLIDPGPTEQEDQQSFEAGMKSDWLDGKLRLNLAGFYNTIDDNQRELNMPDADVVVLQATVNAGDVTIKGFEADFVALIGESLALNGAVGYVDGEYDSKDARYAAFLGDDLPRLAPWTASVGATYDIDLADYGVMTLHANYGYRDEAAYLDSNLEYFDTLHDVNASISYASADAHWRVALFGKNLTDEARWGNLTLASFGTVGPMQEGRRYGLEVQYTF